jgi:preprotein translocase subunit SecE
VEKLKKYFKETIAEMRKMTWPTKDELIGSTIVVVVVSVVLSAFIFVVDQGLTAAINAIFGGRLGG